MTIVLTALATLVATAFGSALTLLAGFMESRRADRRIQIVEQGRLIATKRTRLAGLYAPVMALVAGIESGAAAPERWHKLTDDQCQVVGALPLMALEPECDTLLRELRELLRELDCARDLVPDVIHSMMGFAPSGSQERDECVARVQNLAMEVAGLVKSQIADLDAEGRKVVALAEKRDRRSLVRWVRRQQDSSIDQAGINAEHR